MKPSARTNRILSFILVALFAVGGFFFPILGLGVFGLIAAALIMNIRGRRSFCAGVCPNGTFLAAALKPISRNRRLPPALATPQFRRMLCGVGLFCMIGLLARNYPNVINIAGVFRWIYIIALSVGIVFGILYKPRAWCAICPLGTLQDTVGKKSDGGVNS